MSKIAVVLLTSTFLFAQGPDTLWTRTYGETTDDFCLSGIQTQDGGYAFTGETNLSGGYFDGYILKTDANGDTIWLKLYSYHPGHDIVQTADRGYMVLAQAAGYDIEMMKADSLGDTLWTKKFNSPYDVWCTRFRPTTDGGYIVTGGAEGDVYLAKADSLGDTLWIRIYGGAESDGGSSVIQTDDNGFIVVGSTSSYGGGGGDIYIIKVDEFGDTLWTKTYGYSNNEGGIDICQTQNNEYMVIGSGYMQGGDNDLLILRIDSLGDTLWTKKYGGTNSERGSSICRLSDTTFVIVGGTYSYGAGSNDIWLLKINGDGDTLWTSVFGGTLWDYARRVRYTTDGGYIIFGETLSFGAGGRDIYLIKTNPIKVLLPNGGEAWENGSTYNITWWCENMVGNNFLLLLSTDGGGSYPDTIESFVSPDSNSYEWTLPEIYYCNTCRVKIQIIDSLFNTIAEDISDSNFTILEVEPPLPFSLLIPPDSSYLSDPRPTLIWEASLDTLSGLKHYEVYIQDTLRFTGVDTTWDANYDLQSGCNDWYVIAYDSAGNMRSSNETWTIIIDTTRPLIDSTTIWQDTSYAGPFVVDTKITDTNSIDTAQLFYKRVEDSTWFYSDLTPGSHNWYVGEIPPVNQQDDTVKYYIYAKDIAQNQSTDPPGAPADCYWFIANWTGIMENEQKPEVFLFCLQNNPAIFAAIFKLALPADADVELRIYDVSGRLVGVPIMGKKIAGFYDIKWTTETAGVYFYSFTSQFQNKTGKIIIIKQFMQKRCYGEVLELAPEDIYAKEAIQNIENIRRQ